MGSEGEAEQSNGRPYRRNDGESKRLAGRLPHLIVPAESVETDPSVWTGRALQVESSEQWFGLALLYPALAWSRSLLAIMDIRARSVSF